MLDDGSEGKKSKRHWKVYHKKRKIRFENYKNCLEATQLENKVNHLEKNKTDIEILKNNKKFIKNNKLIL